MIIEKVHINGFGIFNDLDTERISPNLSVIYGENEAGKSTLLAFVRAMFFGFSDGRTNENSYLPLRGGAYGGIITLSSSNGQQYVLHRRQGARGGAVTLTLPDGRLGDGKSLEQLLGFASRDLYRNIFAFSLSELQQFGTLGDDKVKTAIYSAGMGAGKLSLPNVERELEQEQAKIFKPRVSSSAINHLVKELTEVRSQLKAAASNITEFDDLHKKLDNVNSLINRLSADERIARQQLDKSQRVLIAWDDWIDLCACETELAGLPPMSGFPADGVSQLERFEERLNEVDQKILTQNLALENKQKEHDSIVLDERLLGNGEDINRLHRGRDHYDSAVDDLPLRSIQTVQAQKKLIKDLQELGPDWDEEKLFAFNTSIPEREAIQSHRESLRHSEDDGRTSQQRIDLLEPELDAAVRAEQDATRALAMFSEPVEKNLGLLSDRMGNLRDLARLVRQLGTLKDKEALASERENDLDRQIHQTREQIKKTGSTLPWWPALLSSFLGFGGGIALLYSDQPIAGILAIIAFGIAFPGIYFVLRQKLSPNASSVDRSNPLDYLQTLEKKLEVIHAFRRDASHQNDELESKVLQYRQSLHLGDRLLDDAAIDSLLSETEANREELRLWTATKQSLDQASVQLKAVEQRLVRAKSSLDDAQKSLLTAKEAWLGWLQAAGLRTDLKPDGALEIVAAIQSCRTQAQTVADLQERQEEIEIYLRQYRQDVSLVAGNCGRASAENDDEGVVVDRLVEQLRVMKDESQRRAKLEDEIAALQTELEGLRGKKSELDKALADLLSLGCAASAQEFRDRAANWSRRQERELSASRLNTALERIAGRGELAGDLKSDLSQTAPGEQASLKDEAEKRQSEIDTALQSARDEKSRLDHQINELETKDNSGELRMREQSLLAELQQASRKWAVQAITRAILTEAKQRYERERQPGVVRDATSFFERITRKKYSQVLASLEESTLDVLDEHGTRKKMSDLSRGTQEQLYLSVRLGLIREFGRRQESLPVLMDDILVNFDSKRAESSLDAILELAKTHQVLLFTCHPETCELVRGLAPETPIYDLIDHELRLKTELLTA